MTEYQQEAAAKRKLRREKYHAFQSVSRQASFLRKLNIYCISELCGARLQ